MRKTKKENLNKSMAYFFMFFIIIQPILDILTTFSIRGLNLDITVGIIVRLIAMGIGGVFLLYNFNLNTKWKVIYLSVLAIILSAGLLNNILIKDPFWAMAEVQSIGKDVYSVVMLLVYLLVFSIIRKYENLNQYFPFLIVSAAMIINISMVIAIVTGTSLDTYRHMKFGYKGWFYAGNELGTILAIIFPVVVYYTINKVTTLKKVFWWLVTALTMFSLLVIGTKVGYGAVIIVLPIASGAVAFEMIRNRKLTKVSALNFIIPIVLMGVVVVITPYLSISSNTESHIELVERQNRELAAEREREVRDQYDPDEEDYYDEYEEEETEEPAERDLLDELIFSGRTSFLRGYIRDFRQSPWSQRLLGLGYGGNFSSSPKMIERDFHDIFFQYGIIGSFLFMLPFIYYLGSIILFAVKNFFSMFSVKYMMLGSSVAIGLGVAFIAGHVFTAPAVSIYLVTIIGFLYSDLREETKYKVNGTLRRKRTI